MKYSFNLIYEPWIPCLDRSGQVHELGILNALVQAHELRGLEGELSLGTAALYRLLLAVLQRVFGPEDRAGWGELWNKRHWEREAIAGYLSEWERRFDLFDEMHPFYQTTEDRVEPRSIALLPPGMAAGAFYNHQVDNSEYALAPAQAARWLVASQTFGLSGICNPQKKLFFTQAPGAGGVVFLVEGNNLFETLALNLLVYNHNAPEGGLTKTEGDRPAWEMDDPFQPERKIPIGYLDYLTWQNRRTRLIPENCQGATCVAFHVATPGLRLDNSIRDPQMHYFADAKFGLRPLQFSERRALWRDSTSLFQVRQQEEKPGNRPPLAIGQIARLILDGKILQTSFRFRNLALGMASKQAKVEFYHQERIPLPLAYLADDRLVAGLEQALQLAEQTRAKLYSACRRLAELMLASQADLQGGRQPASADIHSLMAHWGYERLYWGQLEIPFYTLIQDIPEDLEGSSLRWHAAIQSAAREALSDAERLAGNSPQALKASVQARSFLGKGLKDLFNPRIVAKE